MLQMFEGGCGLHVNYLTGEPRNPPRPITSPLSQLSPMILPPCSLLVRILRYGSKLTPHGLRQHNGTTALKKKQASGPDSMSRLARAWALQLDAPPAPPLLPHIACGRP